jgi:hypothetical protein
VAQHATFYTNLVQRHRDAGMSRRAGSHP